jgi:hypothetical protein
VSDLLGGLERGVTTLTTTAIRKVPQYLSHARIYLEELFEIEDILTQEYANLPTKRPITFEYVIDHAIVINTREELIEHEGYSTDFSLRLGPGSDNWQSDIFTINGLAGIMFWAPRSLKDKEWEIFGKVEQVFKSRRDSLKTIADSLSFKVVLFPVLWTLIYGISTALLHRPLLPLSLFFAVGALLFAPMLIGAAGTWRQNRIYFSFAKKDQKARRAAWNERFEKFVWLLVGLALGWLADHLKH